jgi:lipoprotein-releasing system permease protein
MLFIAKRIYRDGTQGRVSASAVRIATAGIAVGILVMICSICITIGFQNEIKNKVSSLVGDVQIINTRSLYNTNSFPIQISDSIVSSISLLPGVEDIHRFVICPGMLKTDESFRGVFFRGVDSAFNKDFISAHMLSGQVPSFGQTEASSDSILISASLASTLQLQTGQRVYAYFFDKSLRARRFVVAGIFQTHMADFDTKMCYADSRIVQKLAQWQPDQYSGAEIRLAKTEYADSVSSALFSMLSLKEDAYGQYYAFPRVNELFPQVFSWLSLLDTNVVAILIIMIAVACVTIISGLLIIILERTRFIGVMKSMGATNVQLRHVFLYLSAMIVVRGLAIGNVCAFFLLALQHFCGIFSLDPAAYYLSKVPVAFPWTWLLLLNLITFIVCVLALTIPTFIISRIHPAKSIRFE